MKVKKVFFYLLAALLGGCVPVLSLQPLCTDNDTVFDEKLLGTWLNDSNDTTWQFERLTNVIPDEMEFKRPENPEKAYYLTFTNINHGSGLASKGAFFARLTHIQNSPYLDIFPSRLSMPKDPNDCPHIYNCFFLVPAHSFIKIESIKPTFLKIRLTDDDKMKKLLKQDPNAVQHTFIEDTPILIAPTQELQNFVIKYADDENLFSNQIVLTKIMHQKNNAPKAADPNDKSKSDKR